MEAKKLERQPNLKPIRATFDPSRSGDARTTDATEDWDDLAARIAATPAHHTVRGMFLSEVQRLAPRALSSKARYVAFSLYPVREYMRLLLETAQMRYPSKSPATALLELGSGVYSLFASSLAGTAIFAVVGQDFKRGCELASRAYSVTLKPGIAKARRIAESESAIELRDVWAFPDIFHAGIWLGGLEACNLRGSIDVTRRSLCDVDFEIRWQPR